MRVLLLTDIPNIGDEGETHEVADGYARNHLIPNHLAVPATAEAVHDAEQRAAARRQAAERELAAIERLAGHVDGFELRIPSRTAEGGRLYGAVGAAEIARGLQVAGFAVEEAWVILKEPIKEVGEYPVRLDLPHGLETEVTVIVEPEA